MPLETVLTIFLHGVTSTFEGIAFECFLTEDHIDDLRAQFADFFHAAGAVVIDLLALDAGVCTHLLSLPEVQSHIGLYI